MNEVLRGPIGRDAGIDRATEAPAPVASASPRPPGMVGRARELAEARAALDAAASGTPQVVLASGDAGIGKTTLVGVLVADAGSRGFTTLVGHCLDIDDGVALRAVREALREAVVGRPEDQILPVSRRLAPYLRGESDRATVDDLVLVVAEVAAAGPVLLVLEDLHWADPATIGFVTAVARTARGRLCLALTCRADAIDRRHRLFGPWAELGHSPGARRIDLAGLASAELQQLVRGRGVADDAVADQIVERSEGNPLYAEELLEAGREGIPERLGSLLMRRVDALSEPTRALVRLASVHGGRLDPALLVEATGLGTDGVDAALREGIGAHVLRPVGRHVDFWHGLLREAVHDDLMPGERASAHRAMAEAIERVSADLPSMSELGLLAFHRYAAHDLPAAFAASVRAGQSARVLGSPEALRHWERAEELYDRVVGQARPPRAVVLAELAQAHVDGGSIDRGRHFMARALDALTETSDPAVVARVCTAYVHTGYEVDGRITHESALDLAITGLAGVPTEELAQALAVRAEWLGRQDRVAECDLVASQAIELAQNLDLPTIEALGWSARTLAAYSAGQVEQLAEYQERAATAYQRGGEVFLAYKHRIFQARELAEGFEPERGLAMLEELRAATAAAGFPRAARVAAFHLLTVLVHHGRLQEADRLVETLLEDGPIDHVQGMSSWVRLLAAHGDAPGALDLERRWMGMVRRFASTPNYEDIILDVTVLVANGLIADALQVADEYGRIIAASDATMACGCVAHAGYLALDAARRAGVPVDVAPAARMAELLARTRDAFGEDVPGCLYGLSVLIARALQAELAGDRSVELWRAACAAATPIGPGLALWPRLRLQEALLHAGERDEVRASLPEVVADAAAMGMNGLLDDARRSARRHRIPVPGDARPSKLDVLTAREREVLDVLITGATNKAIAERLFITEKTVSVHVTNLLAKLGVTNRTEAVAVVRDLAPVDPPGVGSRGLGVHPMSAPTP